MGVPARSSLARTPECATASSEVNSAGPRKAPHAQVTCRLPLQTHFEPDGRAAVFGAGCDPTMATIR